MGGWAVKLYSVEANDQEQWFIRSTANKPSSFNIVSGPIELSCNHWPSPNFLDYASGNSRRFIVLHNYFPSSLLHISSQQLSLIRKRYCLIGISATHSCSQAKEKKNASLRNEKETQDAPHLRKGDQSIYIYISACALCNQKCMQSLWIMPEGWRHLRTNALLMRRCPAVPKLEPHIRPGLGSNRHFPGSPLHPPRCKHSLIDCSTSPVRKTEIPNHSEFPHLAHLRAVRSTSFSTSCK